MKRLLLLLLLFAWPAFAQSAIGGATAPPPFPDQFGTNAAANPTFAASLTGWTTTCATWDGTVTHTADGSGSEKVACTSGTSVIAQQNVTVGAHEAVAATFWVKTDAAFNGVFTINLFDNTHGSGALLIQSSRVTTQVGPSSDWVQIGGEFFPNQALHANDTLNIRLNMVGQTAGNAWIDDAFMGNDWYPIRNYAAFPNSNYVWTDLAPIEKNLHGAFMGGATLDLCNTPVVGMVCGFAEIDPPTGQTLSTVTLTEQICTVSDCSSGVLATKTFASPLAQQPWSFTPTDYNGGVVPTAGTVDYLRAKLTVTSGGALIDAYPALKLVFEGATFRNALANWFEPDGSWMHGGVRQFPWGAYDRLSSGNRGSGNLWSTGGCSPAQATAEACYLNDIQGPGGNSVVPPSQNVLSGLSVHGPANIATYGAARFNFVMGDIVGMSTVCPSVSICIGDQLSPFLDALSTVGASQMQIVNNWYHCLIGEDKITTCPVPTFAPTLTAGTGSISTATLWIKATAAYHTAPSGSAQYPSQQETLPSTAVSIALSAQPCAGVNCSVSLTTPTCVSPRQIGWYLYSSTDNVTYTRQYTPLAGAFTQTQPTPCSTAITFSSLLATGIPPPGTSATISSISRTGTVVTVTAATPFPVLKGYLVAVAPTDTTDFPNINAGPAVVNLFSFTYTQSGTATSSSGGTVTLMDNSDSSSPTWQTTVQADSGVGGVWQTLATTLGASAHAAGSGGIYCCDEPLLDAIQPAWYQGQQMTPLANGDPVWCTLVDSTAVQFWRDVCGIINNDPYPLGIAADPDDIAVAPGLTARTCNDYTGTFNAVTAGIDCFVQRIPAWVDNAERETGGTRPVWEVLQLFARGVHHGMTYPVLYQMGLSALISERDWGNMGGLGWWGWVSVSGMENAWFVQQNTQALPDFYLMASQMNSLAPVLMTTPSDSPILSGGSGQVDGVGGETVTGGQVLSNVKITGSTVSADCGAASAYANTTNFPFGEVRFFTVNYTVPNTNLVDQYVFAENLCNSTPTVQFTLVSPPTGATQVEVLNAGRTLTLSGNTFTDTWNDTPTGTAGYGVYAYVIRTPRGMVIH